MDEPLVEVSEILPVPPDTVAQILPSISSFRRVGTDDNRFVQQGGWWYRGEYILEPDPKGTRVTHRVYNVAQRARWAVPLANRFFIGFGDNVRRSFDETLREIRRRAAGR